VHTGFWCGNLRERNNLKDPGLDDSIILKWILKMWDGASMGLIRLRIGTSDGLL